jgi:predicted phage terminase large subunit-like protein
MENLSKNPPNIIQIESTICKKSFYEFIKRSFSIAYPGETYQDNWHIKVIADYLESMVENKFNNLIINIPPRHMKSAIVNVFFSVWRWINDPSDKFIFTSYAFNGLVTRDSNKCKDLINSDWFQERFPEVKLKFQREGYLETTKGGTRIGFGFDGGITGQNANWIFVDDPLKVSDTFSETIRNKVNTIYDEALFNRLIDVQTGKRVIIMQRLHQDDLVGHVLESGVYYEQLILPLEKEGIKFVSSIGFEDPRKEGELLWESRFPKKEMEELKSTLGERAVAGQLQQRPGALTGNTFQKKWFETRYDPNNFIARYISWDTASTANESSAYSACVVGDLLPDYRLFVRYVFRKKMEFPELVYSVEEIANTYKHNLRGVLIESKSSGMSLIQTLKKSSDQKLAKLLIPFNPPSGKETRGEQISIWCENGSVLFPPPTDNYSWLYDFEEEFFMFPNSKYKDMTDSLIQLLFHVEPLLSAGLRARNKVSK